MIKNHFSPYVITLTLFAAISGLLFGYDTGVIAGAILFLKKQFRLDTFHLQLVVAIMLLGAAIGALIAGPLTDKFGRRKVIIGAALLFIIGAFTLAFAQKVSHLITGRILVGLATGISLIATPLYIAEIAPPRTRGFLVTCNQLFVTIGILVAYISNYVFIDFDQGWRYMFGIAFIPALVQAISMLFFPETPRFLVLNHKNNKALKVLKHTRSEKTAQSELNKIQKNVKQKRIDVSDLLSKSIKPAFTIAILLHIAQQVTGINAIIYYAPTIFQMVGFSKTTTAVLATVGCGCDQCGHDNHRHLPFRSSGKKAFIRYWTCWNGLLYVCSSRVHLFSKNANLTYFSPHFYNGFLWAFLPFQWDHFHGLWHPKFYPQDCVEEPWPLLRALTGCLTLLSPLPFYQWLKKLDLSLPFPFLDFYPFYPFSFSILQPLRPKTNC